MMQTKIKEALAGLDGAVVTEPDYKVKGYHLDVTLAPERVVAAAEIFLAQGFFIESITGVDWLSTAQPKPKKAPAKKDEEGAAEEAAAPESAEPLPEQMEVVYDFNHMDALCRVVIRTRVLRDNPELPTISGIYNGADWHERETHDFFGIVFTGHGNLSPLLLPEDADFHPLRKDFEA